MQHRFASTVAKVAWQNGITSTGSQQVPKLFPTNFVKPTPGRENNISRLGRTHPGLVEVKFAESLPLRAL